MSITRGLVNKKHPRYEEYVGEVNKIRDFYSEQMDQRPFEVSHLSREFMDSLKALQKDYEFLFTEKR